MLAKLTVTFFGIFTMASLICASAAGAAPGDGVASAPAITVAPETGRYRIADARGGVVWESNPFAPRFGQATFVVDGQKRTAELARCEVKNEGRAVELAFHVVPEKAELVIRVHIAPSKEGDGLALSYDAPAGMQVESIRLLDDALYVTAEEKGYFAIPVREGLLIPADSGLAFTHSFDTYNYEGCHMAMAGVVKNGAAALVTWTDPYTAVDVRSSLREDGKPGRQVLSMSVVLRKSAKSCMVRFLGKGDWVTIAKAYREVARERGWVVTWDKKLAENPHRAAYLGAANYKLWSCLNRRMNEDSSKELSSNVNWTFDESAQIAEHLKNDLKLDRVLFTIGGWIHRGYDNQHPDILPAAPECGGDEKLADCAKRVRALGYLFCLHDNYQDIYKDSPSWDESYVQKRPDGSLTKGGHWAGGVAYITCSQRAVDLAKRPQNLAAVKKLTDADSYFIDTTYAAGLQECFDPKHPLSRADDMKWKQAISDYARSVFGTFGSECGREWAIPCADFFEGLTGVAGTYYHDAGLTRKLGATVVPMFEAVYRDCIAMYGKYGYDINSSAEYVLHHISIGRPLNYHNVPQHLYWKTSVAEGLAVQPLVAEAKAGGPRQISLSYKWLVSKPVKDDWTVFVHFTDAQGQIRFQGDHKLATPTWQWKEAGEVADGPFTVTVPAGLSGTFDIRAGLCRGDGGERATLAGPKDKERRCLLGKLKVEGDKVEFLPPAVVPSMPPGDAGMYVRGDGGWAAGMHPYDRFVKNTQEVLGPLNEITSRVLLTEHGFLSADRKVRMTVFGEGASAVTVIVNGGGEVYRHESRTGGAVELPPYGFLVESPTFTAFCATKYNGVAYDTPTLFAVRSDGKQMRIFHGFGDKRIKVGAVAFEVEKELTVQAVP